MARAEAKDRYGLHVPPQHLKKTFQKMFLLRLSEKSMPLRSRTWKRGFHK
jgi:hypothetical protein